MLSVIDSENAPAAAIVGIAGHTLSAEEKKLFKEKNPLGFILFARNIKDAKQVKALIKSLEKCVGRENIPVLIDQEGGRVQRLRAPEWTDYPPAKTFGDMFLENPMQARQGAMDNTAAIAKELVELGFTVNCSPVLDVLVRDTHDVIGDRAFGYDPAIVASLGGIVAEEYIKNGIVPIMKHIPGHGRAQADSHDELPVVDAPLEELQSHDFHPFREVGQAIYADAVWAMTAHVVYTALDEKLPATCSRKVVFDIIRNEIGFRGFLIGDDLEMNALAPFGDVRARQRLCLRAGCDAVLHCSGNFENMELMLSETPKMTNDAVLRYNRGIEWLELQK